MEKPFGAAPPELKQIAPFLQRANELRTADPVMAYWCSYYAAQQGISSGLDSKQSKLFLLDLMDSLEAQKAKLSSNDAVTDDAASCAYVENFALKVFVGADNEDRAAKATKATARKFIAASNFIELLKVFGQLEPEMAEKLKYAKWKAADIAKALREGRTPVPGPAGGLQETGVELDDSAAQVQEDAYIAREMAKLTTTGDTSTPPTGEPTAISSDHQQNFTEGTSISESMETSSQVDEEQSRPGITRSLSATKARASISHPSPNFSKPLQHQLPPVEPLQGDLPQGHTIPSSFPASTTTTTKLASDSPDLSGSPPANFVPELSHRTGFTPPATTFPATSAPQTPSSSINNNNTGPQSGGGSFFNFPSSPGSMPLGPSPTPGSSRPLPIPPPKDGLPLPPGPPLHLGSGGPTSANLSPHFPSTPGSPGPSSGILGPTSGVGFAPGSVTSPPFPQIPSAPPLPPPTPADLNGIGMSKTTSQEKDELDPTSSHPFFPPPPPSSNISSAGINDRPSIAPGNIPTPLQPPSLNKTLPQSVQAPVATLPAADPQTEALPETLIPKLSTRVQKLARWASSAIDYDDLETARKQLREALDILEGRIKE
ncbi:DUF605-domain-containing protein [Violaceomyces palustris]|uniref:DUF605-domain-containing protein n=1 Tax=Violaceomyces palustris TaxID=1673888 RepID=A0ACD0P511_9BASI|nr:DUF605-domain-containing protein [Violaceomyces palustris]